jgi:hypothetical protein
MGDNMRTLITALTIALLGSFAAQAQVCCPGEPGSLLVYPCIDNTGDKSTIIEVANLANEEVYVQGYMVVSKDGSDCIIKDFIVHLTPKEPLYWNTSKPYNRTNVQGVVNQIQGFDEYEGYLFLFAVQSRNQPYEIQWNYLKGDALIMDGTRAWQYNAIPHQGLAVTGDRVLLLDGSEYCMATYQIMTEGFAANIPGLNGPSGTLAVTVLNGLDLVYSVIPEVDINIVVWNQNEVPQSRHLDFECYAKYDLVKDLQLDFTQIFTAKWQLAATSTSALYAVFTQTLGAQQWGANVWQHPATGVPGIVYLDPIPRGL